MKKKKTSFIYGILLILQIALLIICYSIYLNKIIKPSVFPYFGLLALIFPISFISYIFILIISFFYKRRKNYIFLILSIPLFFSFSHLYKLGWNTQQSEHQIKLMTYNVKYGKGGLGDIQQYIRKEAADIVFLQEIYQRHWRSQAFLADRYNAVHDYVGISSKYPIVYNTKITLHDSNGYACMADIAIKEDTIRTFSVYLGSIYLSGVLSNLTNHQNIESNTERAKSRLIKGYKNHEKQLKILDGYINESPYPVLIGGDFNSVPNSYEYYNITTNLKDAFNWKSHGLATTFHNYKYPIRIDYFFGSSRFEFTDYYVDRNINYSDHFPVIAYMQIKPPIKKEIAE